MAKVTKHRPLPDFSEWSDNFWLLCDETGKHVGNLFAILAEGWGWEFVKDGKLITGGTVTYQEEAYRKVQALLDSQ